MAALPETLTPIPSIQSRMATREKGPMLPSPPTFAPIGQAVMESFSEGVVVFDTHGRMLYANHRARRLIDSLGDPAFVRGPALRERLVALGGRVRALKHGPTDLGEAIFLADGDHAKTLAEPWLLMTMPLRPSRLAPLYLPGSMRARRALRTGFAIQAASMFHGLRVNSWRRNPTIMFATPSDALSSALPTKPSQTTPSVVPL